MKRLLVCLCVLNLICGYAFAAGPHIIFLLTHDLGYGDIGAFGQKKIRTPNLNQLAKDGMRLTPLSHPSLQLTYRPCLISPDSIRQPQLHRFGERS